MDRSSRIHQSLLGARRQGPGRAKIQGMSTIVLPGGGGKQNCFWGEMMKYDFLRERIDILGTDKYIGIP